MYHHHYLWWPPKPRKQSDKTDVCSVSFFQSW
jgi:hypothetical protein